MKDPLVPYGEKPVPFMFQFDENGPSEKYYIGSEVGSYLRFFRGTLYKQYPTLWRRNLTMDERRKMIQMGCSDHNLPTNITVVKASEVDNIIAGFDEKYKALCITSESNFSNKATNDKNKRSSNWAQSLRPEQHLDAVPCPTSINRNRINPKKRTFPLCFDDLEPAASFENASNPDILVPIRVDLEIDGQKLRDTFTWNKNGNNL
jgi:SWI/SNF-related matrix-associated actin-dependent regulator of chromatin subfamily B member 1